MSKKKRRKKNNQSKKVFNKNLLIKEEIEARKEIELERGQAYIELRKKDLKNKKKNNKRKSEGLINLGFSPEIKEAFINRAASFKKWKDIIWSKLIDQKNLKRDVVIIFLVILGALIFLSVRIGKTESQREVPANNSEVLPTEEEIVSSLEEEKTQEIAAVQAKIDTEKWKDYKSN